MADKKRPPHPHGPWPSVFPPDGRRPPWPPYPHTPQWNDTEPVIGVRPGEECCEGQDECVCVTSGDVDAWYNVYDTVAQNSATWGSSGESGWTESAGHWNSTYETVSDNSASWNSASERASQLDPDLLNELAGIIDASSAFLATYSGLDRVYTKKDVLTGIGTPSDPIDLDWKIKVTLDDVNDALLQLYKDGDPDQKKNWVHVSALKGIYDWLEEHDALFWKVKPNIPSPYDGDTRKPDGVFDQLEKIWALLRHDGRDIPESANWNSTYVTVTNNSGRWESVYNTLNVSSGDFYSVYNSVAEYSAAWNEASAVTPTSAEEWNSVYETVNNNSGYWQETTDKFSESADLWNSNYETVNSNSAKWESSHDTVNTNSAYWGSVYDTVEESSAAWNETTDKVNESADKWNEAAEKIPEIEDQVQDLSDRVDAIEDNVDRWNETSDTVSELSGFWNSTHDTVYEYSASWNKTTEIVSQSADKWNQTYEVVDSSSGHWDHIAETVEENSAVWAKDAFRLQYEENMNYDNFSAYNEPGVIYYNYNKEY